MMRRLCRFRESVLVSSSAQQDDQQTINHASASRGPGSTGRAGFGLAGQDRLNYERKPMDTRSREPDLSLDEGEPVTDRPVNNTATDDPEDYSSSSTNIDGIVINEVQLLLAEKRTSLATMRTGIAVFTLPLSVLSILIATSRYYDISHVLPLLVPLLALSTALVFLGCYLVVRAMLRIFHQERLILAIKQKHGWIAEFL